MRRARIIFLLITGLMICTAAKGQESDSLGSARDWEPELITEEGNADRIAAWLEALSLQPLDLNRASLSDLMGLPGMDLNTARAIINYRDERSFKELRDLKAVPGMRNSVINAMRPYVVIRPRLTAGSFLRYWNAEWMSRMSRDLQDKEGYLRDLSEGGYAGDPWKAFQRLSLYNDHVSMNLTLEKDPGEQWKQGLLADHSSGYVSFRDLGPVRQIVFGDFSVRGGQGLITAPLSAMGKGREVTSPGFRGRDGIRPYGSAQESGYLRGIGIAAGEKFRAEAFVSRRKRTASQRSDGSYRLPSSTGLHRTVSERSNREVLQQSTFGASAGMRTRTVEWNVRGIYNHFDKDIGRSGQIYDRHDLSGRTYWSAGADHRVLLGRSMIFGEFAYSHNGGWAVTEGMKSSWESGTEWLIAYRHFRPQYQTLFGNAVAEGSGNSNEEGWYTGLEQKIAERWRAGAYVDLFRFPEPRFGMREDSQGKDLLGFLNYRYGAGSEAELLFRFKSREKEYEGRDDQGREIRSAARKIRQSLRLQLQHRVHSGLRLRSRIEWVRAKKAGESCCYDALLIFQDIRWQIFRKIRIDSRYTFFDSPDYASRLYQFENDLLYVMTNSMLNGTGRRFYVLIKADLTEQAELWFKFGQSIYEGEQEIGSGLDRITGNVRSSVGFQVRIRV